MFLLAKRRGFQKIMMLGGIYQKVMPITKKYPLPHPPCSLYMTKRNLSKGAVIISGKNARGVAVQNALKFSLNS